MRPRLMFAGMCLAVALVAHAGTATFVDPLQAAAPIDAMTSDSLNSSGQLSAIGKAGTRLVAVGLRGLIVVSDDQGKHWRQVPVPVSSDLLAVQFVSPSKGWAVGQDGVVLHSDDGGEHWLRQFEGNAAHAVAVAHFQAQIKAGEPTAEQALSDVELNYANGPEQALLDLWFEDEQHGFVVGSFGTLFATDDGGATWQCWMDRVEAPELLHLNAIRGIGSTVYIASEQGFVFKLDRQQQRFMAHETGYPGSFFSLAGFGNTVVAFGLLGNVWHSIDGGDSWKKVETGTQGSFTSTLALEDGRLLAVTRSGQLLVSADQGRHFSAVAIPRPMLLTGLTATGDTATLVGLGGVQAASLAVAK